ncbi:MAG: hypothetical protein U9R13_09140 [Campylobacterota bacterium]|nr:hypothetical protein [Campylobacterota bacterium]
MNKFMMIISVLIFTFSGLVAEDTRDTVQGEILKSIDAVEQARQDAVNELRETVRDVEAVRAMREGEQRTEETIQTKAVESQAVRKIEKSTALVEKAKTDAKESIVNAVAEVEKVKAEKGTIAEVETAKMQAVESIAKAVSSVEVAKAKAAKVVIEETGKVELSKMQPEQKPVDEVSVPPAVKNISVVEVTRIVTKVELGEVLEPSDENEMNPEKDKIKSSYPTKFIKFPAK